MVGKNFVLDLCYGTPPGQTFDPDEITKQYAAVCKRFGISAVIGDHYSAGWVLNSWKKTGVTYVQSLVFKSQIYLETAPLFSAGLVCIARVAGPPSAEDHAEDCPNSRPPDADPRIAIVGTPHASKWS
jgi:hypothetical protein